MSEITQYDTKASLCHKGPFSQSYGFSGSHTWMWDLDHKEGWVPKNWCFLTVVLEKTLESPLDCKEIQPVYPKGNQLWISIRRTDAEAEAPILWPSDAKSWLIRKDPDAGKNWRQKEKGMTEDEMVGWHHRLNGHEFEQTPGDGEGQGSLVCCSPWVHKESDTNEWLNNDKGLTWLSYLSGIERMYTLTHILLPEMWVWFYVILLLCFHKTRMEEFNSNAWRRKGSPFFSP